MHACFSSCEYFACALVGQELAYWITDFNLSKHVHLPIFYMVGGCACQLNVFPRFVLVE